MRDPERIDRILEKLGTLWRAVPDQRLGQLVINLTNDMECPKTFNIEDDDLEKRIDEWLTS